ncbi:MAG TPA: zinc-dependent metalloprotease [Longimicrobiales bacterium]
MKMLRPLIAAALLAGATGANVRAQETPKPPASPPTIADKVAGAMKMDGYMPVYWDEKAGRIWLEIPRFNEELLYYVSLPTGLGSNDIGLNRGDLGPSYVVKFERVGQKVMMTQSNQRYRAITNDALERKAVTDAFPTSIIWGFKVEAEQNGRVLVDATDFFVRDAFGVINTLRGANQGSYRMDASRSAIYLPRTKAFPKNTEVEVTVTLTSDAPGGLIRSVAPSGDAVTVREHHSFVELPGPGYTPREADPRAGYFGISYMDFATPIDQPITKRFIARHRLEKKNPNAKMSEPVEPIVYYLDPGTPEPVRSALLDGARWWNDAFEAAGFINAFRVEMLPADADPMDLRYNVIQWVHRSTRGWSYGNSVTDPRTGEILKGHVTLGSLRVRQDYLLGEGLTAPYVNGTETANDVSAMAVARIRQLAAHEVGHTLGLAHNYIASTQRAGGVQSVMDYPHPVVTLTRDGRIDLSGAYPTGIGEWDKVAIRYGYSVLPNGNQYATLDTLLLNAARRGISFLSDQDARSPGSAHPQAHLWDNGGDVVSELDRMLEVRNAALQAFGERAIKARAPMAMIEEALVPLYLHHRYQTEGAIKTIGGQYYTYAMRGDGQQAVRAVPAAEQRRALDAVLRTISPGFLALPQRITSLIPPRPYGYGSSPELFDRTTGPVFDVLTPAAAAADMTLSLLLNGERAARLVEQNAIDPSLPGLGDVLTRIHAAAFAATSNSYEAEIARTVQRVYVENLMELAGRASLPQARAIATLALNRLSAELRNTAGSDNAVAHAQLLAADIDRFVNRPIAPLPATRSVTLPPGQPIGDGGMQLLDLRCDDM